MINYGELLDKEIEWAIDGYSASYKQNEHRRRLGLSAVGTRCLRQSYYSFRWVDTPQTLPRIKRLFRRGDDEEAKLTALLRGSGWTVHDVDPNTGKQFLVHDYKMHVGGSADGVASHPHFTNNEFVVVEYKTHNTKSFTNYVAKGLADSKPQHYAQGSCYAYKMNLHSVLYVPVNKNDDDIKPHLFKADYVLAEQMLQRAKFIVDAAEPPRKISNDPNYFECSSCDFKAICHARKAVERNCRSCKHASAVDNGEWHCGFHNSIIPLNFVPVGCDKHLSVNE